MVDITTIERVYFIGIGGIGMSALARYFKDKKIVVKGYDKTKTSLTKKLETEGVEICYEDQLDLLDRQTDIVVYTPAIPSDHGQLNWYKSNAYHIMKRAEMLGMISTQHKTIAVAGTHGKTTASSMISHILTYSKIGANSILGGIPTVLGTNYVQSDSDWLVTEADEFDRSFLHLSPTIGVVMSIDPDHLDIYGDFDSMKSSFLDFINRIVPEGLLLIAYEALEELGELKRQIREDIRIIKFGSEKADVYPSKLKVENARYVFDLSVQEENISKLTLKMGGRHNVENASVAVAVARILGIEVDDIRENLLSFQGIKRRFEWIVNEEDVVMIDDYAHHPTELKHTIAGVKELYPNRELTVVFQPHLYSRTRDFLEGFAEELSKADQLILVDIYPAREKPIEGVSSAKILEKVTIKNKVLLRKGEVALHIKTIKPKLLLIVGAGDINTEIEYIRKSLKA